jgi:DNA-binding GntR family transcriptional regulator
MSMYARSHSSDCAVDEHSQIIEAIREGDKDRAMQIMGHHLGAVAGRAELLSKPDSISAILSHYGKELAQ